MPPSNPTPATIRYLNYINNDETGDATLASVYGPNLPRLRQIKAKYDPDNIFHSM